MSNNAHCVSAYHSMFPRSWEPSGTLEHGIATVLRRRPFSACNKGNRRRLYAGKSVVGRCLLLEVIAQSLNRLIQLSSFKPRANRHNIVAQQLLTLLEVFVSVCTCLGDCNFWFLYCTLLCWCQLTSVL